MKTKIFLVILLGLVMVLSATKGIYALYEGKTERKAASGEIESALPAGHEPEAGQSKYAPGELIIKFGPELGAHAGKLFKQGKAFKSITRTDSLDNLNKKYKVQRIERVFKVLEVKGKLRGKDFITAAEDAQEIKQKFPQRAKRAPKDAKIPDLENIYLIELEDQNADILSIAEEYKKDPHVAYVQPNYLMKINMIPNDPSYNDLWGLKKMQCEQAWDMTQGEGITVAVIDTGVDYNHEDLAENIRINEAEFYGTVGIDDDGNGYVDDVKGWDFAYDDNDPMDVRGHGTHCAGTIAAVGNNNLGVIGVAPNAKIIPVKGLGDGGSGYISDLAAGIVYAADNGADVLSNSWGPGGRRPSDSVSEAAVDYAYNNGCIVVFAAGNSNDEVCYYSPANYAKTIAVAATDANDEKAGFSNYGSKIAISAPGVSILSSLPNNQYAFYSGTSMACPHISGAVALILSKYPNLTVQEIKTILQLGADSFNQDIPSAPDKYIGKGRVNVYKSLLINNVPASIAQIDYPQYNDGPFKEGTVQITGSATGDGYTLEYAQSPYSDTWTEISSGGPVQDGILGEIDLTAIPEGLYYLRLKVDTYFGSLIDNGYLYIDKTMRIGWPQNTDSEVFYAAAVADLDGDGGLEIVVSSVYGNIYAWHNDGTLVTGWPKYAGVGLIQSSPAIVDIDGDGALEIVVGGWGYQLLGDTYVPVGIVNVLRGNGSSVAGWPQQTGGKIVVSTPAIGDLDGDGKLDIIIGSCDGKVYAWHHDGSTVTGWPVQTGTGLAPIYSSPAVADLDNDGNLEVVIGTESPTSKVYVWRSDGSLLEGWPKENLTISGSAAIADLDGDGDLEIVIGIYQPPSMVYAWHHDGSLVTGWPKQTNGDGISSSASIADLDGDGGLEIVIANNDGTVYAWHSDGSLVNGWPKQTGDYFYHSSPAIADLDGDGTLEVIIASNNSGKIYAWHSDGSLIDGWSKIGIGTSYTSSVIADLDGNGTLELVLPYAYEKKVHVWDIPFSTNDSIPWPMFRHDAQNTGNYIRVRPNRPPVLDPIGNKTVNEGELLGFTTTATDPDNDPLTYSASNLPQGATFTNQTFNWTPAYDQAGTYGITFDVSDGNLTDSETITITVNNTNRAPDLAPIGNKTVDESQKLEFTIYAADPDNDVLTLTVVDLPPGATIKPLSSPITGSSDLEPVAIFNWTPNYNQAGIYRVTFKLSDGRTSDSEAITITVRNVNRPPIVEPIVTLKVAKGSNLIYKIAATDPDGDTLTYYKADMYDLALPPGSTFDGATGTLIWNDVKGSWSNNFFVTDGKLDVSHRLIIEVGDDRVGMVAMNSNPYGPRLALIPDNSFHNYIALSGDENYILQYLGYRVKIYGEFLGWAYRVGFCYNVTNIAVLPLLNPIGNKEVNEGNLLEFNVSIYYPCGQTTFSASNLPPGATFDAATQTLSWTPAYGQAGQYQITFLVSNENGQDSETINIKVNNMNRPPELGPIGNKAVDEGQKLEFAIYAADPDGGILTLTAVDLPPGATLKPLMTPIIVGVNLTPVAVVSWTPNYTQAGIYTVKFALSDGKLSDSETITIRVKNVNRPPVLNPIGNKTVKARRLLTFTISGSDPDGDTLTYSATNLPAGTTFNPSTRVFSWKPTRKQIGSYSNVTFTVKDSGNLSASEAITIKVNK